MSHLAVHKLGTALKVVSVINENTADSAKITIKDPSDVEITGLVDINMTKVANKVYQYIWQTTLYAEGGVEGIYTAVVKIKIGSYTGVSEVEFKLERT